MTYSNEYSLPDELLEQICTDGFDALPDLIRTVINTAMVAERQKYLGAGVYQRSEHRVDQANGYKPKTVATRVGQITREVPQVRQSGFYPSALRRESEVNEP